MDIFLQNGEKFFLNYCQNTLYIRCFVLVFAATKYQRIPSTTVFLFPAHSFRNLQLIAHNEGGQKLVEAFFVTADTKIPVNTLN